MLWTECGFAVMLATVPLPLPRAFRRQLMAEDAAKLELILAELGEHEEPASAAGAAAAS